MSFDELVCATNTPPLRTTGHFSISSSHRVLNYRVHESLGTPECIDTCIDVIEKETPTPSDLDDGRKHFVVSLNFDPPLTDVEIDTISSFVRMLESAFPDCKISLRKLFVRDNSAQLDVVSSAKFEMAALRAEITTLAGKLRVAQATLIAEAEAKGLLEKRINDYETLIAQRAVSDMKERGEWPGYAQRVMLFCFVDIVGFSGFPSDKRARAKSAEACG